MDRKPICSVLQWPAGVEGGPIPFLFNAAGKLGLLQADLEWRLCDFCRIHQIVYQEIERLDNRLKEFAAEHKDIINPPANIEGSEILQSRVLDAIVGQGQENERVTAFVDQMSVVGLWAIAEQFLARVYRSLRGHLERRDPEKVAAPYRWSDFIHAFLTLGIDLTRCENFANANECRAVNNAVKHDPVVGPQLVTFSYFKPHAGANLINISLEMQRYFNGVSDFLGSLIETGNSIAKGSA